MKRGGRMDYFPLTEMRSGIPGVTKKCSQMDTLVNTAQAVVQRNQKCLDADGNHFDHLL